MHQIFAILDAVGWTMTIVFGAICAIICPAAIYFCRQDKKNRLARSIKQKEDFTAPHPAQR
jgi:hypothetical protein